ncbi:phasin family protein [Xanthomonas hortorum]|uniref:Phasin family protein n=1 Tax=Xanthomonas hortorum pv. hederae TaxID=453603 RepID=A0A9X3YZ13_9XANT|nr:phasin family protein [Xanthomonas hortorum]MCE4369640.1 phasin family protein [Xanthomonas hortorum pv. hederae]MDC8637138.1 phasin family protein [Xanthomonas hortorum pv. hederae]PPU86183.1 hypothetical protein XhhCFBP4925_00165 [Xanthomonas hortorum pv. hederae]PUF01247.1 hypothetical protein C7T87_04135 [Xanthomonas hortorum pv. hederae]
MSQTTDLPLNLYKANLRLEVSLFRLLQENSKQWIDFGYRLANDAIAESDAENKELLDIESWQKLATLPAESFWRQLQQRFGDTQAFAQIATSTQTAFASGLQDAARTWQQETAEAMGSVASAAPAADAAWTGLFKPWEQLLADGFTHKPAAGKPAAKGAK